MKVNDVRDLLLAWGTGRHINSAYHLDYPHETPFNRMRRSPGRATVSAAGLEEDMFDRIDSVVSELATKGDLRHPVIALAYVERMNDLKIGKTLRIGKTKARECRIAGENWVAAKIDALGICEVG
jgi:hypothetical protein